MLAASDIGNISLPNPAQVLDATPDFHGGLGRMTRGQLRLGLMGNAVTTLSTLAELKRLGDGLESQTRMLGMNDRRRFMRTGPSVMIRSNWPSWVGSMSSEDDSAFIRERFGINLLPMADWEPIRFEDY